MGNLWHFGQWPSFMPKYGNFENRPVSRKPLPIEEKKVNFNPLGEKEGICATFGTLANGQVSSSNMAVLKISETTARRAKVSSILTPWKGNICELWQMAKLVLKQSVKAHGPLVNTSIKACFFHGSCMKLYYVACIA